MGASLKKMGAIVWPSIVIDRLEYCFPQFSDAFQFV